MRTPLFPTLLLAGALLAFSGCAPSPGPRPGTDGVVYDSHGNILYDPRPGIPERPADSAPPEAEAPDRPAPPDPMERPSPEPAPPRIGAGPSADADGHLIAAVSPLAQRAREQMERGEYDRALSTAERAIRIDGTNPELWQLMARIQLERGEYDQAEQLARKSNQLAGNNHSLQAENWHIIADAHAARGERSRAEDARKTARRLERRQ